MKQTALTSPFRPSSRIWAALALVIGLGVPGGAVAQVEVPVLTIDQDRLFSETQLGAERLAALEEEAQNLAAENQRIEAELIAEEQELTARKDKTDPATFRDLADGFNDRVRLIRSQQDEKARELNRTRDEARGQFFRDVAAIISGIVREKGALVVLDRRDVFLSADSIDITDEAIRRVNESVGVNPD